MPDHQVTPTLSSQFLEMAQVAAILGVSDKTLKNWRLIGKGPKSISLSRKRRVVLPADLDAFILSRRG